MMIAEPMTLLTDYVLAGVTGWLAWRLWSLREAHTARLLWAIAFGALALAAAAGGSHHGFAPMLSSPALAALWKATVLCVGIASFGMLCGSAIATITGNARRLLLALAAAKLAWYSFWMLAHDDFIFVIADSGTALAGVAALHLWNRYRHREGVSRWMLAAAVVSALAAAVQASGFSLHQHFNHNDLYHVIQIAAMALFYNGARLLQDLPVNGTMNSGHFLGLSSKGFHRVHYTDWGNPAAESIVICVHGLTRNCRDFDFLAQALLPEFRVVCPDVAGRGQSDWLHAKEDYAYPQYCADMTALIARVTAGGKPRRICWVGTSMGGIIGMLLASRPKSPIAKLVLNDVGIHIPRAALERIGSFVGKDPRFKTLEELEAMMRIVSAPFGPLTEAQWRHLSTTGAKQHEDGSWGMRYDPGIGVPFQKGPLADVDLSQFWDNIACPTLLLRGANSDLLLKDTALAMTQRGPRPRLVEFEGVGHAPMLMAEDQIKVVRDFLLVD